MTRDDSRNAKRKKGWHFWPPTLFMILACERFKLYEPGAFGREEDSPAAPSKSFLLHFVVHNRVPARLSLTTGYVVLAPPARSRNSSIKSKSTARTAHDKLTLDQTPKGTGDITIYIGPDGLSKENIHDFRSNCLLKQPRIWTRLAQAAFHEKPDPFRRPTASCGFTGNW